MANFREAYDKTIKAEGGYHSGIIGGKVDSGGETYMGIARRFNPEWAGWAIIDRIKSERPIKYNEVIKDASLNALHYTYAKRKYWDPLFLDRLSSQQFANFFFDFYFHRPAASVRILQSTIGVPVTGRITADTINVLNSKNLAEIYPIYYNKRIEYYKNEGSSFVKAFINRVKKFPAVISDYKHIIIPVAALALAAYLFID